MSKAPAIECVYNELMKYIMTLREFRKLWKIGDDEELYHRPFYSLNAAEKLNFTNVCTKELNLSYKFVREFLLHNKGILNDYVQRIHDLFNYKSDFKNINALQRSLLNPSNICFGESFRRVVFDLRCIIGDMSNILELAFEKKDFDTKRWFEMVDALGRRMMSTKLLYKSLVVTVKDVQLDVKDTITNIKIRYTMTRQIISYLQGTSNDFPDQHNGYIEQIFGEDSAPIEQYLRELVLQNMTRDKTSIEHLQIIQRSFGENIVEMERFNSLLNDIVLFSVLYSKFRETQFFHVLDSFQILMNAYEKLSESTDYED